MAMPEHLVLVRHVESEGNLARSAAKREDLTYLTDEYRERPGHEWRITKRGQEQAVATGQWIQRHILDEYGLAKFGRYLYSPHRRTRETAGHLALPNAKWRIARLLREREHGEAGGLTDQEFQEQYPKNFAWMLKDPLHWAPPGGESISQVADNRVRELFDTLHREHDQKDIKSAVAVTHGEFIWASRLVLDYMLNEDYQASENDKSQKIHNGQVVHYTRLDPKTGSIAPYLRWSRSVCPFRDGDVAGEWRESRRRELSNQELLAQAAAIPRLFDD